MTNTLENYEMFKNFAAEKDSLKKKELQDQIVTQYYKLLHKIAIKFIKRYDLPYETGDLIYILYPVLVDKINQYDLSENVPFTSFAYPRLKGRLLDFVRTYSIQKEQGKILDIDYENDVDIAKLDEQTQSISDQVAFKIDVFLPFCKSNGIDTDHFWDIVMDGLQEPDKEMIKHIYLFGMSINAYAEQIGLHPDILQGQHDYILEQIRSRFIRQEKTNEKN